MRKLFCASSFILTCEKMNCIDFYWLLKARLLIFVMKPSITHVTRVFGLSKHSYAAPKIRQAKKQIFKDRILNGKKPNKF
jgi:hypothetical protein